MNIPATTTKTWVVIGDSILSSVPQGTAAQLALHLVSAERNVIFKNISSPAAALGISDGSGFNSINTTNTLTEIAGYYAAVDGIVILAGTNDFSRNVPWGDTVASLRRILDWAKALNKKVLILDPIWRADESVPNAAGNVLNIYRYFIATVAGEYPGVAFFGHRENTLLGTSAGAANYDATEVSTGKQLHPNVNGHRLLANWIKAEAATAGFF